MFVQIDTAAVRGVEAFRVRVEVNLSSGLPSFAVVGLAQGSVREGRERVAAALRNSGFGLPNRRITVNLAPADVRKAGTAFDLPIAVGILGAGGHLPPEAFDGRAFVGELGLDGTLRPVSGVLSMALRFVEDGIETVVVPAANAAEAGLVDDLEVVGARDLTDVVTHLEGGEIVEGGETADEAGPSSRGAPAGRPSSATGARPVATGARAAGGAKPDLRDIRGQHAAKRALEIAAAGSHNLLLSGPPGAGKTMLARRLPGLLPPLSRREAIEVAQIHSVAGLLLDGELPLGRPFRAPHHSISYAGLHGGGTPLRPGEVSLAHHGVLFLDELPEYRRDALEMLRQPLEEGRVHLSRVGTSIRFPSRVLLVAAMNPCPCGFHGDGSDRCTCDPATTSRYRGRVSGPLLDRMDLHVHVGALSVDELERRPRGESTVEVAARVRTARERQLERFGACSGRYANAQITPGEVRRWCRLDEDATLLLRRAAEKVRLSARGYDRVLRVARTVADLAGSEPIGAPCVAEALQYRTPGVQSPG